VLALALCFVGAASANTLSVTCSPGLAGGACDQSGAWQTSPVSVAWHVDPVPSAVTGCASQTYTDVSAIVSCSVSWGGAGPTISFPLNVETTSPSATATPDRPPDANGWYNHPVTITLAGSAFSGIASCTPAQAYAGPAIASTALSGTCTDNAGKTASASFPFRYDATPPSLTVTSQPADRLAGLSWHAAAGPAPLTSVQIARQPGLKNAAGSMLYSGTSNTSYEDRNVSNGTAYTYTITAADQAGNVTQQTVKVTPGIRLLSPSPNARLKDPPTLRWTAIPKASYYNVQLFKGSKILSAWPTRASFRLAHSWKFGGKRHRLARGRYHWYVWPGYGPQRKAHYGRPVGHATFVIK
jgi:hypothetical protein